VRGRRLTGASVALLLAASACAGETEPGGEAPDAFIRAKDALVFPDADGVDSGDPADAGAPPDLGPPDTGVPLPDQDMDGIPDDEDPQVGIANPLLFSDSFAASTTWLFSSVDMRIDEAAGLLRLPSANPLDRVGWLGPQRTWTDTFVRARVRVTGVGQSTARGGRRVGVLVRTLAVVPGHYVFCGVDMGTNEIVLAERDGVPATLGRADYSPIFRQWMNVSVDVIGPSVVCRVDGAEARGRITDIDLTSGSVGFWSNDVAFDADWIEVYAR
jgi:hypothetical protein